MPKKFLRQDSNRHSKLGRKKIQKWRKPKGTQSKMRRRQKSYPVMVAVGFKRNRKDSGKIKNLIPITIKNLTDLQNVTKSNIAIISSRLGAKKKIEVIKKLDEMKIKVVNLSKGGKR